MSFVKWDQLKFGLGIPSVDNQHKTLIEILNQIADLRKHEYSNNDMIQILRQLYEYTKTHFADEEQIMKKYNYPGLTKQQSEHRFFVDKVKQFIVNIKKGNIDISDDMYYFLRDWTLSHIQNLDVKYMEYLKEKGVDLENLAKSIEKNDFVIKSNSLELNERNCPLCDNGTNIRENWAIFYLDNREPVCYDCCKEYVPELFVMLDYYYSTMHIIKDKLELYDEILNH